MRCQGLTKSGRACSRLGPWCAQHEPGDDEPRTNLAAFEVMVSALRERDALLVDGATVQLARTLAGDMDIGQVIVCDCGERHSTGRNAALVKQYRDLIEVMRADASSARPDDDIWSRFDAARSVTEVRDTPPA